jgi:type IV pilus assembly protein PilP
MNKCMKLLSRLLTVLVLAATLAACSNDMEDLESHIASVMARPADPIPPIPPVRTYTAYEYEGLTGRDPFRPSLSEGSDDVRSTKSSGPRPDFDRPKEYLERYELDTLAMVGTFSKEDSEWALIRDPEGVIHRVPVGNYIGKNHGKVVNIEATQMDLSELISDGSGGWLVREATIALGE